MTLAAEPVVLGDCLSDTVASPARIRDAALGGQDNYAADRDALRELDEVAPGFADLLRVVRAWHVRVVRHLAARGFGQFLDLAAGLPAAEDNTHQTAQRHNPDAKVVYTGTDNLVLSYERALLDDNDTVHVVHADGLDPHALLAHETVSSALDPAQPVAVLLTTGVQDEPDDDRLAAALSGYRALLPPGSALALSCWAPPSKPGRAIERTWAARCHREIRCRTENAVERLFTGFDLLDPGLVRLADWWPDGPLLHTPPPAHQFALGGVGIKS
ncbi:SAM-dependent methyltransferase [Amycolatopsis sp., V23-08]|uniref:SAM-dependent methyltransferase n=1 Tax=Amycolatopsis heterodermiae TaxID=3110235 RepID=A0ABU5RHT8_9PSEU|nr:SAM-dependent methyltransferase [Amycolatopsis sp., V23-08]MEA5365390.1 SAM-dependent methyltransferase [Amycolatopsis sp., V23-08]